jgi:hypothetical protein
MLQYKIYPSVPNLFSSLNPKHFYHWGTWTSLPDWPPEPPGLSNTMPDLFKTLHALTLCGPTKCLGSTAALTRQMDGLPGQGKVLKKNNLCDIIYPKACKSFKPEARSNADRISCDFILALTGETLPSGV